MAVCRVLVTVNEKSQEAAEAAVRKALTDGGADLVSIGAAPMTVADAGKRGGQVRKQQLGPDGYSALGRKGGGRVRELIERGKRAEAGK